MYIYILHDKDNAPSAQTATGLGDRASSDWLHSSLEGAIVLIDLRIFDNPLHSVAEDVDDSAGLPVVLAHVAVGEGHRDALVSRGNRVIYYFSSKYR